VFNTFGMMYQTVLIDGQTRKTLTVSIMHSPHEINKDKIQYYENEIRVIFV